MKRFKEIYEDAQDEKRMMRQQLMFISYAAKEIAAYVDRVNDPEEWYQNKMATTHSMMKTLYSYAQGQMQSMNADDDLMAGYYGEEITKLDARRREFKEKLRKLAYEKYGKKKVDAVDKAELDEETWKEIEVYAKKHGGIDKKDMLKVAMMLKKGDRKGAEKYARGLDTDPRDWLLDKMDDLKERMDRKSGADGHSDGQSDSSRDRKLQDKDYDNLIDLYDADDEKVYRELINLYGYKPQIAKKTLMRNNPDIKKITDRGAGVKIESVEQIDEANFKPGNLKLKDGKTVKISMDDAKAITAVMKTLSSKNRKEMETRMMADKKGFDEIMAFVDAAGM